MRLLFYFSFIAVPFAPMAQANTTCVSGVLRKLVQGKFVVEKNRYCSDERRETLLSEKCRNLDCAIFKLKADFDSDKLNSTLGKPGFKLCKKLGGAPELIEFQFGQEFFKLDRCHFPDGMFADTGTLLAHYQSFKGRWQ